MHNIVKVAIVANLINIYFTIGTLVENRQRQEEHMVPSICHIWYYTTLRLFNSEGNGNFSVIGPNH